MESIKVNLLPLFREERLDMKPNKIGTSKFCVKGMEIRPITFKEAKKFNALYHRHNPDIQGCKFCISCWKNQELVGVAICGRPVSRYLDNGKVCEINRLCTDGTYNACSMLYSAACRVAKAMGYEKMITYTLLSEPGTSLKASSFVWDGVHGGLHWSGQRKRGQRIPAELKNRWYRILK